MSTETDQQRYERLLVARRDGEPLVDADAVWLDSNQTLRTMTARLESTMAAIARMCASPPWATPAPTHALVGYRCQCRRWFPTVLRYERHWSRHEKGRG